jgi:hypothetical protein
MRPAGSLRLVLVAGTILTCGCLSNNKGQIEDTKWTNQAATVNGNDLPAGTLELDFHGDGTLGFRAGPQRLTGTYSLGAGDTVVLNFDSEFAGLKVHSEEVHISGDRLTMTDSDGTSIPFAKATAAAIAWQTFSSDAGRFSVLTPAILSEQIKPVDTVAGKIDCHMFVGFAAGAEHGVSYNDYPQEQLVDPASVLLDRVRDGAIKAVNGRLLGETSISLDENPGREVTFEATNPNGAPMTSKSRIFLVGNRLYQIYVAAGRGELRTSSTDKFLQSFKLLKQ